MTRGKSICSVLKTIRKQIADANEIKYEPRECHHQGECRGTCPACEAEVKFIERQLDIRRQLGKAVVIVGISASLSALSGCGDKAKKVDYISSQESDLTVGRVRVELQKRINGDVEYHSPVDSVIIEKEPKAIKKRTASFKKIKKEKEDSTFCEVLGSVDIIEDPVQNIGNIADENYIYDVVEQMPSFPGGQNKMLDYLEQNMRYPVIAEENGIQGRVVITFVVERDGSIDNVIVARSVDPSLDKEATRLVKRMPKWNSGKQNGKAVRTKYTIPVDFRLK